MVIKQTVDDLCYYIKKMTWLTSQGWPTISYNFLLICDIYI